MSSTYQDGPSTGGQYRLAFPPITPMVKRLVVINFAVYGIVLLLYFVSEPTAAFVHKALGLSPDQWRSMFPFVPFWQLFSYGFLHSTLDVFHVIWNMLLLYFFGTMVEGIIGSSRFLAHYLGAMVAGAVVFLVAGLFTGGSALAVGASGAALGMVVAAACFRPDSQVILIVVPVPLKILAIGIVAIDLINGALSWKTGASDGVAHLVHLGGAAYGFLAVRRGFIWRDPIQRVQAKRAIATEEKRQTDERHVDDLLQKIHREGLGSLSRREREFLRRVSRR